MAKRETREEFEQQMAIVRKIMGERWVALRALALGDQHPETELNELLDLAYAQRRNRKM